MRFPPGRRVPLPLWLVVVPCLLTACGDDSAAPITVQTDGPGDVVDDASVSQAAVDAPASGTDAEIPEVATEVVDAQDTLPEVAADVADGADVADVLDVETAVSTPDTAPGCESAANCPAASECHVPICNADGSCGIKLADDETPCASGACAAAACAAGACVGTSNACDDGNPCTVDACEPKTGACSHVATAGGAACSQNGMCGTCTAGLCTQNWLSGSDEFNGTALGSQWSIVNPDAAYWSLSAVPGSLQILFENGDIWKTANNASNVFLQPAPTGAFEITAKVAAKPSVSNNHASILLWQDMDNNVQLTRQFSAGNGGAIVNLTMEQGAAASNAFIVAIADVPVIWLRLAVSAGTATGYYSVDGATWILAGVVSAPTKLGQIGLFCHGVQESAAFDWFHVSAACTP